jgi:purine-nucleoside phosphorylase
MYKSFTAKEQREHFGLPTNYCVEALLSYGAWDRPKHDSYVEKVLKEIYPDFSIAKLSGFLQHVSEIRINEKIYWFVMVYGSAMLSEIVHLASIFGSKKNIHIGSCGGLNTDICDMGLIVPSYSFGNESTTRTYEPEAKDFKHYPDEKLSMDIINTLPKQYKDKIWRGPIITNQAMMGETWDDVKSWSKQGYFGVEMETSTVFAVSNHFNVPSAGLVYVSDNLVNGQTVGDETHISQKEEREKIEIEVYRAGLKVLIG